VEDHFAKSVNCVTIYSQLDDYRFTPYFELIIDAELEQILERAAIIALRS
jgi:hypothetical protein